MTTTGGSRFLRAVDNIPRERLAELVSAAAYGSALVLAALSVIGVSEVSVGHGGELVAGVGVATWIAHLFAEVLGERVRAPQPVGWSKFKRAMADGSPILVASVLPALVLLLGRLDVMSPCAARALAIVVAVAAAARRWDARRAAWPTSRRAGSGCSRRQRSRSGSSS